MPTFQENAEAAPNLNLEGETVAISALTTIMEYGIGKSSVCWARTMLVCDRCNGSPVVRA